MVTLLMTRPAEASRRFLRRLPAPLRAGLEVVVSPLIGIEPAAGAEAAAAALDTALAGAAGLIFTSGNGVAVAASLTGRRDLPCFCVGRATTDAAAAAGWRAECAGRDADELVAALSARRPPVPLLHLRGTHARGDIAARLGAAGLEVRELAIYHQRLLPPDAGAESALGGRDPVVVPLFSPRTARHFASLCPVRAPLYIAAMSKAVAEPLVSMNCVALEVARSPDAEAMAEVVAGLIRQAGRLAAPPGAQ